MVQFGDVFFRQGFGQVGFSPDQGARLEAKTLSYVVGEGTSGHAYFTPDINRTVGLIKSASTTAAPIVKAATEPNSVGSGIELAGSADLEVHLTAPGWGRRHCHTSSRRRTSGHAYFTPDINRTVGLIKSASTTAAPIVKAATEPNSVGSGIEL